MNVKNCTPTSRAMSNLLWLFLVPTVAAFGVCACMRMIVVPMGVESLRGKYRTEVSARLMQDDERAFPKNGSAQWVNREKGTAKISLSDSVEMSLGVLKAKLPKPSQVKIDPEMVFPAEAPRLPSAPSGAATIRFRMLPPSLPEIKKPSTSNQG